MDDLHFIVQGQCQLFGVHKMQNDELRIPIVKLKEGSWFGDYQIMLNVRSTWDLQATKEPKDRGQAVAKIP